MRKCLFAVVLLWSLLLLLTGCNAAKETGPKQEQLKKVTVLLDWTPNTNHTGVYVAQKRGYYKEQGLDVEIIQPSEGGAAQLVAAGQGDFGFSYQEEVTIARTTGVPVKALAAVIQHNTSGFASPVEKGIKSPKDFEGKKYGGWGSPAEEEMIKALMNQEKADFKKVAMINIGTADFFASIKKDVDFTWIFWGWTGIESEQRGIPLNFIRLRDYNDALDFYTPLLIASDETVKNNPALVAAFMKATAKGYADCIREPKETGQVLLDSVPELNKDLVLASQAYLAREYKADAPVWGQMTESRWQKYADWMYGQGLIEKPLDYQQAFTNEFLPKE
ncbi:ABC transporter substrate-binding protein [Pelotomaculum propionicicum]|uniref:Formylaminopyrimidine-binding protein n=1 Tax=Pelotomaculum propionicicum TaxID=258475 RepID=A0A4Y7RST2_9FIRM|nr:ABC transporter substrate-binding protein [Pelotomaculum propionicicum]NLI13031.1 ABC transporter substrate-binding protein [Peptococcaceae bacterium]TEB11921.1 Formylaminopyrimidine-binding protein [Pelotomaculum propionicicum]